MYGINFSSISEPEDNELYLLFIRTGSIWRFILYLHFLLLSIQNFTQKFHIKKSDI